MSERFIDDLAKALRHEAVSRQRALRIIGGAIVVATVSPLFPQQADASVKRARRRCRKKKGAYLRKGDCACGIRCDTPEPIRFGCQNNPDCFCYKAANGKGFCSLENSFLPSPCATNADCSPGRTCVTNPGCPGSGSPCTQSSECPNNLGCINGACQVTYCSLPCPA